MVNVRNIYFFYLTRQHYVLSIHLKSGVNKSLSIEQQFFVSRRDFRTSLKKIHLASHSLFVT